MSQNLFKADLHVHSYHSGQAKHLRILRPRDCYSAPLDVYRTAKQRGMSLVTITDHDSIDGCLEVLARRPGVDDFIISEEVTTQVPELRHTIHVAVYDINEAQHREIQRLRRNAAELVGYLEQQNIIFALNHVFFDFDRYHHLRDYLDRVVSRFRVVEGRNGAMQREHNRLVSQLVRHLGNGEKRYATVAGSDSHTLRRIGTTYTASSARTREEFLEDIRCGRTMVCGRHANHWAIAADIYGVVLRYYPSVLRNSHGDYSLPARLKNILVSLSLAPFLFLPYLIALRNTYRERRRIAEISRRLSEGEPALG